MTTTPHNTSHLYSYPYPRPAVTATLIVLSKDQFGDIYTLIGKRSKDSDAYPEYWCFPGGFLNAKTDSFEGENVKQAAIRELYEETGLVLNERQLHILNEYSNPETDPRAHTVNIVFYEFIDTHINSDIIQAGDDLSELKWININDKNLSDIKKTLAFNHAEILGDMVNHIPNISSTRHH